MQRPAWLQEPEEIRRWRLGLEPLDEQDASRWQSRCLLGLWLVTWLLVDPAARWPLFFVAALIIVKLARDWYRHRRSR